MDKTLRKSNQTAVAVILLGIALLVMLVVSCVLPLWSKYTDGTTTYEIGIWEACTITTASGRVCSDMPGANNDKCSAWIVSVQAFTIIASVFFFFTVILALLVLVSKKPWGTKGLRLGAFICAFIAMLFAILAWVFWFCFGEFPNCTSVWRSPLRKYDASYHMTAIASLFATFLCCLCAYLVAMTPRPPAIPMPDREPEVMEEVYEEYPTYYEAPYSYAPAVYAPEYTTMAYVPAPAYPGF